MVGDEDVSLFLVQMFEAAHDDLHAAQAEPVATAEECPGVEPFGMAREPADQNRRWSKNQQQASRDRE